MDSGLSERKRLQRAALAGAPKRVPMGRLGMAEEIAQVALFLCTPLAGYVTGAVVPVDGGWLAFGGASP